MNYSCAFIRRNEIDGLAMHTDTHRIANDGTCYTSYEWQNGFCQSIEKGNYTLIQIDGTKDQQDEDKMTIKHYYIHLKFTLRMPNANSTVELFHAGYR